MEEEQGIQTPTLERPEAQPRRAEKVDELPPYNVVLLNDDDHSFEYVIEMLAEVFAHPPERGFKMAEAVDKDGRVVVYTTHKEKAELKQGQIHAFGKDQRIAGCQGSMSAVIEPVPG